MTSIKTLLFLMCIIIQPSFIQSKKTRYQKFSEFLYQPKFILTAGLTSIGFYTGFNGPLRTEAYSWLKDRWNETPTLIKYSALFFTSWWVYNNWHHNRILEHNKPALKQPLIQDIIAINRQLQWEKARIDNMEAILNIKYPQIGKSKILCFVEEIDYINNQINDLDAKIDNLFHDNDFRIDNLGKQLKEINLSLKPLSKNNEEKKKNNRKK